MHGTFANRLLIGFALGLALIALARVDLSAQAPCGNGIVDPGEDCDPPGSITCPPGSPAGAFLPCNPDCTCGSPGGALLDHFKCYKTRETGQPRFASRSVTLVDQYVQTTATVKRPTRFCNPADKNGEGIIDPTAHLMCYSIKEGPFAQRSALVRNQFGDQVVTVLKPESLCAPAEKNGVSSALNVDHFKCYRVRGSGFVSRSVTVADQFETGTATLLKPTLLCNPVDKNGEGVLNPAAHLACYQIKKAAFTPRDVTVVDQFATQDLRSLVGECRRRAVLCVPSEKDPSGTTTTTVPTTTSSTTTSTTSTTTTTAPPCGNGTIDPGEDCDPPGSLTCPPTSVGGAFTECNPDCTCGTTTTTSSSTTTVTTTTTTTTIGPLCCGAERTMLTSSAGTLQVDNLPPFPFPSGVTTTMDTDAGTGAECVHSVIVPAGGFFVPNFDIPALNYCSSVTPRGCESGSGQGAGNLWDGNGTAGVALTNVSKVADTSDGVCDATFNGTNCTTAGVGANTLGDIDSAVSAAPGGGVRSLIDIPVHSLTWSDSVCSPAITPGCCPGSTYNPADGDLLITEFDFILSPTTNVATGAFVDKNADGCKRAGAGFDTAAPGADGPKSLTGSPAAGPCCVVGQATTVVSVGAAFSGGAPLFDLGFKSTIPNTVASCGTPATGTCTVTTNACLQ